MSLLQIIVLAIVQGITEFLPISSSGHLILVPTLTDWPDQGLMMDVGVHLGTLFAVMLYFRKEISQMFMAFIHMISFKKEYDKDARRLMVFIILATIPVVIIGYAAQKMGWTEAWRTIEVIGYTSIIFGFLLYIIDVYSLSIKSIKHMKYGDALIMGFAQVLAIIPGTSRSGITMTAARGLGFTRTEAARFSMLMSIPTIIAAALLSSLDLIKTGDLAFGRDILIGIGLSFVTALIAIAALMKWLEKSTMTIFVIYRILLGVALLGYFYFWS
jgi:undecaprenyl-diphosphatase